MSRSIVLHIPPSVSQLLHRVVDVVTQLLDICQGRKGARKLLERLFQQMVLVSLNQFGPLCVATCKETAHRFRGVELASWNQGKSKADAISFKVDQPNVFLNGVGVYEVRYNLSEKI